MRVRARVFVRACVRTYVDRSVDRLVGGRLGRQVASLHGCRGVRMGLVVDEWIGL